MSNPFVHVELQTKDLARAKDFYSALFGWKLEDIPVEGGPGSYTMINVGEGWRRHVRLSGCRGAPALAGLRRGG